VSGDESKYMPNCAMIKVEEQANGLALRIAGEKLKQKGERKQKQTE
jgi:hypothetical protein